MKNENKKQAASQWLDKYYQSYAYSQGLPMKSMSDLELRSMVYEIIDYIESKPEIDTDEEPQA